MLTSKQRAYLRAMAAPMDTIFQVGKGGVNGKLISPMTEEEIMKLRASADTLRGVIASLKI